MFGLGFRVLFCGIGSPEVRAENLYWSFPQEDPIQQSTWASGFPLKGYVIQVYFIMKLGAGFNLGT